MSKQGFVTLCIVVFENVIFGIFQMLSSPLCSNASILSRCGKGMMNFESEHITLAMQWPERFGKTSLHITLSI